MDAPQLTDLIHRHAGLIHKVAWAYCRDATDREDVVQEILLQMWRSHQRFDGRCRETTWVYRIAINVAISCWRREWRHRRKRAPDGDHAISIAAAPAPEPNGDVEALQRCIAGLPALDRALVLLWLDGNDHAAIGEVLGLSISNVGTRLHRIKDRLRTLLAPPAGAAAPEETHGTR